MRHCRYPFLALTVVLALAVASAMPAAAQDRLTKLRFGVGPLQPTPSETKKAYARADQISGGQQQRVAIARALAQGAP